MLLFVGNRDLGNQLTHVINDYVFGVRVDIRVKRNIHESHVDLILYYIKLFLVFLRADLGKHFRNLGFAKSKDAFILKISTEWHFDKAFIGSNT